MPTQIANYKVFVASPGGLDRERKEFQATLGKHNQSDALARGCMFDAIGWEITLGGVGRPQEKINQELRECDYAVIVLWDRWGSPTGSAGGHTSGTEEEYRVACASLADNALPLTEIVVFFKAVDARQLSDPGPQLQAVLKFKKELEESKAVLFETFDTPELFGEKLRRHLAKWTRDHESSMAAQAEPKNKPPEFMQPEITEARDLSSTDPKDKTFIDNIETIYKLGKLTDAEQKLVSDLIVKRSVQTHYSYALFLIKSERLSDAEVVLTEMRKLALSQADPSWAGTAEARLGGLYRVQGKLRQSQDALESAIGHKQTAGDERGEMSANIWLGDLLLQFKKNEKALDAYRAALTISNTFADERLKADLHFKVAKCLANLGECDKALDEAEIAREIYEKLRDPIATKSVKHWRKSKGLTLGGKKGSEENTTSMGAA